ncbi:MAG: exodeoxyribonuclease V subunit gamma [Melioribacter sp.]|nr:exodeoxyribonuclease V subunit gamma [Melioribacter sp.]
MILTKENIDKVDLNALISEKINNNLVNELLIIVPTNRKARNLKKEIISSTPQKASAELNIETLGTISTKLLSKVIPFKELSEAASIIFIKQSFLEINPRYFSLYKTELPFGTLDKIKNVISEYKRQGINPDNLREEANKLTGTEKLKALDIADIYEKFLAKCNLVRAYEIGDIYYHLNNLDENNFKNSFFYLYPAVNLIIVIGFHEFSFPELKILNRLSLLECVKLFINFDYNKKNKFIFSHLDKYYNRLKEFGFNEIKDLAEPHLPIFRRIIRDHLFNLYSKEKKYDLRNKIFKIEAFDKETEVELISRQIKILITKNKVEPSKICVAFNLIKNYSAVIRDIFTKNGLPFNLTDRISLDNSNPVKSIVNFLEIAENDYYYQNILRALSNGYIATKNIDTFNLYKVCSLLKIISGKENWINTINESIENIKLNSDEEFNEKEEKLNALQKALIDIKKIINILEPFEKKQTIKEFKETLFKFIIETKLHLTLLSITYNQEENIRGLNKFIETVSEVLDLLEEEKGKDKKFTLDFFLNQIRTACSWARFNVKEKSNYGVLVTNLEEIRGLNFDYLFIGGLFDGDLPTRYNPEIFSSGTFRKLASLHQAEERNLFYQALCSWSKGLYLSFPLTEDGRELVPSIFLKEFEKLFTISELKENDYSNKIFSIEETEIFVGKSISKNETLTHIPEIPKEIIDYDKLVEAIKAEKIREINVLDQSVYTGYLLTKENESKHYKLKQILSTFVQRQYSISQLETYAKCPFKFYLERIIGIKVIEEPTEEIEAIELGRILHSILYEFYTEISNKKIDLFNCDNDILKQAKDLIFEIAEKKISQSFFQSPITFFEKEKLLGINQKKEESILSKFVEYEFENNKDFYPAFFEVNFGSLKESESDKNLSSSEPLKIAGINLRGKIDRIELSRKGNLFNIVDYKLSGKKPSTKELINGISLQLPVYLLAAQYLLEKKYKRKFSPNKMIIYSLKYSQEEFGKSNVNLSTRNNNEITSIEELINNTINHIKNFIESISEGKFNLSPHEERENLVCKYCQFKTVCRIQELI